jgi:radical SAM superfamily enzyme YgiQ (UPF0313 family)
MSEIVVATLNSRYSHASLGLRYLLANMGELQPQTRLLEFIISQRPIDIVEKLLSEQPRIIGLGVYIWNIEETTKVVAMLKAAAPEIVVVLGGPEVSYETDEQPIVQLADYVITGWGDVSFPALCHELMRGKRPAEKILPGIQPPLDQILLPYRFYTEEDLANRLIYVEASRGCPFKCEFCLSSLDKTAWPFDLDAFLAEMKSLYDRGARQFKFVDRTFNLNIKASLRVLEFFLERMDDKLFLHFEVIPDHLPDKLKEAILRFPPGSLQFEVGIQTFNPEVQALINRKQDNSKSAENLAWLRNHSHAHIHADLIAGLPGESLESFGKGFNHMVTLGPHDIQLGILKRLRGTPIGRHAKDFGIKFNPLPPYNILCSDLLDFMTMQRISRFARYWEMIGNTSRYTRTLPLLLGDDPFGRFMYFADWLFATTGQTHQFALERLYDLIFEVMTKKLAVDVSAAYETLSQDYAASGARGAPRFLNMTASQTI